MYKKNVNGPCGLVAVCRASLVERWRGGRSEQDLWVRLSVSCEAASVTQASTKHKPIKPPPRRQNCENLQLPVKKAGAGGRRRRFLGGFQWWDLLGIMGLGRRGTEEEGGLGQLMKTKPTTAA